jgi:Putative Actinobacterial Holin-X, holin superfamily III
MAQTQIAKEERSLGDLFSELAGETSTLVRQEVALAQVELTQKATEVGKNVGFLVVGGAVGYAALLAIIAALIIGLSYFIPAWVAALLVGAAVGIAAYLLISSALAALKKTDLTPRQTVETLKEDAQWLKNQVS